jgi:hypothetical protein
MIVLRCSEERVPSVSCENTITQRVILFVYFDPLRFGCLQPQEAQALRSARAILDSRRWFDLRIPYSLGFLRFPRRVELILRINRLLFFSGSPILVLFPGVPIFRVNSRPGLHNFRPCGVQGSKISGHAGNQGEPMGLLGCSVFAGGYRLAQGSQEQSWPIKHR